MPGHLAKLSVVILAIILVVSANGPGQIGSNLLSFISLEHNKMNSFSVVFIYNEFNHCTPSFAMHKFLEVLKSLSTFPKYLEGVTSTKTVRTFF